MAITLCGTNSYLIDNELSSITENFEKKYKEGVLERFDASEANFDDLVQATHSASLFSIYKLVIIREINNSNLDVEKIKRLLTDVPEEVEIVFLGTGLDKRTEVFKCLKKLTKLTEYLNLEPYKLPSWLVEEALNFGIKLNTDDAMHLINRVGSNQAILYQELKKLAIFSKNITKKEIDELTVPTPQSTIFQLLEAAFMGNTKNALKLYDEQKEQGTDALQILGMIIWQMHILAIILWRDGRSPQQISSDFKLNPYVVQKSIKIGNRLSKLKFKKLIDELYKIEISSKSTKMDTDEALKNLIVRLNKD